jgi:hypothetical protein
MTSRTEIFTLPFQKWLDTSNGFVAASKLPLFSETEFLFSVSNGNNIINFYFNIEDDTTRKQASKTLSIFKNAIVSLEQSILDLKLSEAGE